LIRTPALTGLLVALLGPVAALATEPAAQDDGMSIYLTGGVSLTNDPPELSEFWDTGLGVGTAWGFQLSPQWEMLAALSWQRFPADEAAQIGDLLLSGPGGILEIASLDGRDVTAITATAEMRFHVPTEGGRVLPYLSFGWGLFNLTTSDATVTPADPGVASVVVLGESDTAFGVTIGGGLQVPVGARTRVLLDCAYTVGFTERISTQYLPVRLGLGLGF